MTIEQLLNQAMAVLDESSTPRIDAEVLLAHVLQWPRSKFFTHPQQIIQSDQVNTFHDLVARRQQGEPIAYIIGRQEFWSLELKINPAVIIPRPESELVVETAIELFPKNQKLNILELGTGSGAIALAIACQHPNWQITATDNSEAALAVARNNAEQLGINNVNFVYSHWYDELTVKLFDMVISNPPYIAEHDIHLRQGDLRFEPQVALASGHEGLDAIRAIINNVKPYLKPQGYIIIEHGYQQKSAVQSTLQQGGLKYIMTLSDLAGLPRVSVAQN